MEYIIVTYFTVLRSVLCDVSFCAFCQAEIGLSAFFQFTYYKYYICNCV